MILGFSGNPVVHAEVLAGIPNFHEVTPCLYRGGRPTEQGLKNLRDQKGVKTIIDLQGGDLYSVWRFYDWVAEPGERPHEIAEERNYALALGMNFESIPLDSVDPISTDEVVSINRILAIMNDSAKQPVYIHCQHGKDRTGLLVALYEVLFMGIKPEVANQEWQDLGHDQKSRHFTFRLDDYFRERTGWNPSNNGLVPAGAPQAVPQSRDER